MNLQNSTVEFSIIHVYVLVSSDENVFLILVYDSCCDSTASIYRRFYIENIDIHVICFGRNAYEVRLFEMRLTISTCNTVT